jgi:pyocin large subunit-like protein
VSLRAIIWAFKQNVRPAATKFVLVALADYANDYDGCCYPSTAAICEKTSLDRKTVLNALVRLQSLEKIADTGRRVGPSHQVKMFQLCGFDAELEECAVPKPKAKARVSQKRDTRIEPLAASENLGWGSYFEGCPENGTPENGTVPFFPSGSTENGTRNLKEPQYNNNNNTGASARDDEGDDPTAEQVLAAAAAEEQANAEAQAEAELAEAARLAAEKGKRKPKAPTVTWSGSEFSIPAEKLAEWKDSFPLIDVDLSIKQARGWLIDNPQKRYSNFASFLRNWLSSRHEKAEMFANSQAAQAKGGSFQGAPRRQPVPENLPKHTRSGVTEL